MRNALKEIRLQYKTKFLIAFIAFGIALVSITGWVTYSQVFEALKNISVHRLTTLRELRKKQVEDYFTAQTNQLVSISEDSELKEELSRISIATSNTERARLQEILQKYAQRFQFNSFIVQPGSARHAAIRVDEASVMRVLSLHANVQLVLEKCMQSPVDTAVFVSDFFFDSLANRIMCAIASPIIMPDKSAGAIAGLVDAAALNNIMTSDKNWIEQGFGATGETYLIGSDYLMRSDSRFSESHVVSKTGSGENQTTILHQKVITQASKAALAGETNTQIVLDYRGIEVLSSYTPFNSFGLSWAVCAEIDTREAFSLVYALRENLVMVGVLMILLGSIIAIGISRIIAKPINRLIHAANSFAAGNLQYRTDIRSNDEFELLGSTLNEMAEKLDEHRNLLKNEVEVRRKAEAEVLLQQQRLRELSSHLQSTREEERKGIAREIHDELGQLLNTLKIKMVLMKDESVNNKQLLDLLADATGLLNQTLKSLKRIITNLRPQLLDDLGLVAAIEWQAKEFENAYGIATDFISQVEMLNIPNDTAISIFRILQEALTNIARHAHASKVTISLYRKDDAIILAIADNGIGIKPKAQESARSFGILGMKERARYCGAELNIHSSAETGTSIILLLRSVRND